MRLIRGSGDPVTGDYTFMLDVAPTDDWIRCAFQHPIGVHSLGLLPKAWD
jgi:hypothetical protein